MRFGFCIIFNGLHHLLHTNFMKFVNETFDYFVFVEGLSGNSGSTAWCKFPGEKYHFNYRSLDGTIEYLKKHASESTKIYLIEPDHFWKSKDEMVNAALLKILTTFGNPKSEVPLWQIDCDEEWKTEDILAAEIELCSIGGATGCFHANYYVGEDLIAKGCWGEGNDPTDPLANAYRRLWMWDGRLFKTHEPPVLMLGNTEERLLKQRFNHYAYLFPQDVEFKQDYYTGHDNIYQKWLNLKKMKDFPVHISNLISGYWGNSNTMIDKIHKIGKKE